VAEVPAIHYTAVTPGFGVLRAAPINHQEENLMLKKSLLASALALLLAGNVFAQDEEAAAEEATGPWEISLDAALTSDYVFRGVSQSQEEAALQAGLNFDHESGFYTGIWGSSIDFTADSTPPADEDGANVEIDLFVGYGFELAEDWAADVQLVRYIYPGTNNDIDYDYNEFIGAVTYNDFITASIGYSNDVFNSSETGLWLGLSATHELPWWGLSVSGDIGTYDIAEGNDDGSDFNYLHYGLSFSKSFGELFTATLGWANTDDDGQDYYGEIADSRVYLTVEMSTGL
jgi:uncharacterized protein (TIGR02001 family)